MGNAIDYDDGRRGAYVDHNVRAQNQPVTFNRQTHDIAPTLAGARGSGGYTMTNSHGNNRTNSIPSNNAPLAISDGRDLHQPAARQVTYNRPPAYAQNSSSNNYPRANNGGVSNKGPARAA